MKRKVVSENRGFKGVWIPKEIWLNDNLNATEILVLTEIDSLDSTARGCFASNQHFSDFFGLSKSRMSEIIKQLEKKGFITISYVRNGKEITSRTLRLTDKIRDDYRNKEVFDKQEEVFGMSKRVVGKPKESNTTSNTSNIKDIVHSENEREANLEERFNSLWKLYPVKKGKALAFKSYKRDIKKKDVTDDLIAKGIKNYILTCKKENTDKKYMKHGGTYFSQQVYLDELEVDTKVNVVEQDKSFDVPDKFKFEREY